jgi:hypothetical protein
VRCASVGCESNHEHEIGRPSGVVELIAPLGGGDEIVKGRKAKLSPHRKMKFLTMGTLGREVRRT